MTRESTRLEDQAGVTVFGKVKESKHVEVIVKGSCHILANHTLPLSFSSSKVCLIFFEVFN